MTERIDRPRLSPRVAKVLNLNPDHPDYRLLMDTLREVNRDLGLQTPVTGFGSHDQSGRTVTRRPEEEELPI